jgi:hypothetical protein
VEVGPTIALVLETNNLQGGDADARAIAASLGRLLLRLRKQTRPIETLDELVITHDGIGASDQMRLRELAGAPIQFVRLARGTGYYEAKNQGFDATGADIVVFGDADCWPDPDWLERLIAPFDDRDVRVVAGRTTYRDGVLGQAATAIDFMYFPSPLAKGATRNFYANNVAFRREVFARHRYTPLEGTYRGHCQLLGMRLFTEGTAIHFEPRARTIHRFPDSAITLLRLRQLRGGDTVSVTPHLARAHAPKLARWAERHAKIAPLAVLGARLGFSLRSIGRQDMAPLDRLRSIACAGAIVGITLADARGAIERALGRDLGVADGEVVLSYHADVDELAA